MMSDSSRDQNVFMQQMNAMNTIIREMKEIPDVPSESAKDNNPLEKVEFPESGGVLTFMTGHEYPFWGFPYWEFVEKIDLIKKISRAVLSGFYHSVLKRNRLKLLAFIPVLWAIKEILFIVIYVFYRIIERFKIKPHRFSPAVQELYRVFSISIENETEREKEFRMMFRDLICMVLEFDNAYRFRFQDITEDLDKTALQNNPIKEFDRLLSILSEREKTQEVKDTWKLMETVMLYYLRYDKRLQKLLTVALSNMNIDKVKLSKEDKYFSAPRIDYTFKFMASESKEDRLFTAKGIIWNNWQNEQKKLFEKTKLIEKEVTTKHIEERKKVDPVLTEKEKIELGKRIEEAQNKYNERYQKELKEFQNTFESIANAMNDSFLTDSQKELASKQTAELQTLQKSYEDELKQLEENWANSKKKVEQSILRD